MKSIFGEKGIKAGHHSEPKRLLINAANELKKDGAEAIILACTEIPLALQQEDVPTIPLINPTKILAQKAVDVALGNENL